MMYFNLQIMNSGRKYDDSIITYLEKENLSNYFMISDRKPSHSSLCVFETSEPFLPELDDLVRLHKIIRRRKVFTIPQICLIFFLHCRPRK